jgi:hypothetical protein
MLKGMYEVGVEFSSGTGWDVASQRMGAGLRSLNSAIERLDTATAPIVAAAGNSAESV